MESQQSLFARLVRLHPDVALFEYLLDGERYTIGRLPGVFDIVVSRRTVSRIHARLERTGSHYTLVNVGRNQTFINQLPIDGVHVLNDRDAIGLASPEPLLRYVDSDPTLITAGHLHFDETTMRFRWDEQVVELTPAQLRLMHFLYQQRGQVCSREACAQAIWGNELLPGMESDNLDKVIFGVRVRFREIGAEVNPIQVRRGLGFTLSVE
mgnify:FL=1